MFPYDYVFNNHSDELLAMDKIRAANLAHGANPAYSLTDFLTDFPQFSASCTAADGQMPTVPTSIQNKFLSAANDSLSYNKYGEMWSICMGYYIAHFITLFLAASLNSVSVPGLISASAPPSLVSSESADDLSKSYDTESIAKDLEGFAVWKATTYGIQLATFAQISGMGGMLV
jgi:hypothetical protein